MAAPPPFLLLAAAAAAAVLALTTNATLIHIGDLEVLEDIRRSITNPDALTWPNDTDPCVSPGWPHVYCDRSGRVSFLDLKNLNLTGALPASFAKLDALQGLDLQNNLLRGPLPSLRAMAVLRYAHFQRNYFDSIPPDCFDGLGELLVFSLDDNFLINASAGGWTIPPGLATSAPQLRRLLLDNCGLVGGLPESLGAMAGLQELRLSRNRLSGPLPASFRGSGIQILWIDNQLGEERLSGTLDVIAGMAHLKDAMLQGNDLSGTIPDGIVACTQLTRLWLNNNRLVGLLPPALAAMPQLQDVRLDNNRLVGPTPALKAATATFSNNGFCSVVCAPEVMPMLGFLAGVGYPQRLADSWSGNDPCSDWLGVFCYQEKVYLINLPGYGLNGTISGSLGNLSTLSDVRLNGNNLTGHVPDSLASLKSLKNLDLSNNDLAGPLPAFNHDVNVSITGNPNFSNAHGNRKKTLLLGITVPVAAIILLGLVTLAILLWKKRGSVQAHQSASVVDIPDPENYMISLEVLRAATNNFAPENVLGRGGFGVVYKGVLHDGTAIAVKRIESIESMVISNEAVDQFKAEITILTKARHRNVVSIVGYSVEGSERLIVYKLMSNGDLSKHLFRWKRHGLEPLCWKKRLSIALDVARGMEYLHSLARQCFIHRDLKPGNILLGDDFRAKVADFGLAKSAPASDVSVLTQIAGTKGYLAPEYAVTGKLTTKADIFSFGVVLMELITGLTAIDENRGDEAQHLPSWFCQIWNVEDKMRAAIDAALILTDELESISAVAELAVHCTSREPSQRPDMGHVVTVLVQMVEKWTPSINEAQNIDLHPPVDGGILSFQDISAEGR